MTAFNKKATTPSLKIGKEGSHVIIIAVCSLGDARYIYTTGSLFKRDGLTGSLFIIIIISMCVTIIKERNRLEGY